jgi:hypothetical protein
MQAGNISQFLSWGYSSTGLNHAATGDDLIHCWIPSEDQIYLVEESASHPEPAPQ